MTPPFKNASCLALTTTSLLLAACGGGDGASGSADSPQPGVAATSVRVAPAPAPSTSTTYTLQQRIDAAGVAAATDPNCAATKAFYWEIGDKTGKLASGTAGDTSTAAPPTPDTVMIIASASKWIFGTYVVEKKKGALSTQDVQRLNMTSGYTNFDNCSPLSTVASCLTEPGTSGGTNGDYVAANYGKFYYDSGHMQQEGNAVGLGPNNGRALGAPVVAVLGSDVPLTYNEPQLAGGVNLSPAGYAQFLRNLLGGRYPSMLSLLGTNAVCAHANSTDCPTAVFSPVNQSSPGAQNNRGNEAWHYSLGHWVEDDPNVGDGAFSSLGKGGFYPWVDKTKTYYGVLAPNDPTAVFAPQSLNARNAPINCGRNIRHAWEAPGTPSPVPVPPTRR